MKRKVILSKRAARSLEKLLEFLERKWSVRVRNNFIEKLDKAVDVLKDNPESSPESEIIAGLRRDVITKQTTIYY